MSSLHPASVDGRRPSAPSVRARIATGSRGLFFVWLATSALAILSALPVALALAPTAAAPSVSLPETLADSGKTLGALGLVTLTTILLQLVLGPFLQQTWIASFDRARSFTDALAEGVRQYVPSVFVSLWLSPALVLALAVTFGLPIAAFVALDGHLSDRGVDLSTLFATLPGLLLLAVWATWHDLARAAVASDVARARDAVRRARRALSAGAISAYLVLFTLGALSWVLAQAVAVELDGLIAMGVGQALVLTRLGARGMWLASAHTRVR